MSFTRGSTVCNGAIDLCLCTQPTAGPFPPEGTELGEGAIPLPGVSWLAMQPQGPNRLLSLPLWLSLQFLGEGEGRREGGSVCSLSFWEEREGGEGEGGKEREEREGVCSH